MNNTLALKNPYAVGTPYHANWEKNHALSEAAAKVSASPSAQAQTMDPARLEKISKPFDAKAAQEKAAAKKAEKAERAGKAEKATTEEETEFDILHSDCGNARLLIEQHGKDIRYHIEKESWIVWNGQYWSLDKKGRTVAFLLKKVIQNMRDQAQEAMTALDASIAALPDDATEERRQSLTTDLKAAKALYRWSVTSEASKHINGTIQMAISEPGVTIHDYETDRDPYLFNCESGTIDLRTCALRAHRREDYITKIAPVKMDAAATCPLFINFMNGIFPDNEAMVIYMQTMLGYCLSGLTIERFSPFLIGEGANGKSVLCNVILAVMGHTATGYGKECGFVSFTESSREDSPDKPRNDIMRMQGKRFLTASEAKENSKMDMSLLKRISGNDQISTRANYGEETEFKPQAKVWLRMNHEPRVPDDTDSSWDRIKKIGFLQKFEGADDNKNLTQELIADASGILNWLLEGWKLMQASWSTSQPVPEPVEVRQATRSYRDNQSFVIRFFNEHYRVTQNADAEPVSTERVFREYVTWMAEQGRHAKKTSSAFGTELAKYLSQYPHVKKDQWRAGGSRMHWFGIEKNAESASVETAQSTLVQSTPVPTETESEFVL
jgi:putative DNA primase/helicase